MPQCFMVFLTLIFVFLSSGCGIVYRPDTQQGNIITAAEVAQIRPGMSHHQIIAILGSPVLVNPFNPDQDIYVYTFQHRHGKIYKRILMIWYEYDRVVRISTDMEFQKLPPYLKAALRRSDQY